MALNQFDWIRRIQSPARLVRRLGVYEPQNSVTGWTGSIQLYSRGYREMFGLPARDETAAIVSVTGGKPGFGMGGGAPPYIDPQHTSKIIGSLSAWAIGPPGSRLNGILQFGGSIRDGPGGDRLWETKIPVGDMVAYPPLDALSGIPEDFIKRQRFSVPDSAGLKNGGTFWLERFISDNVQATDYGEFAFGLETGISLTLELTITAIGYPRIFDGHDFGPELMALYAGGDEDALFEDEEEQFEDPDDPDDPDDDDDDDEGPPEDPNDEEEDDGGSAFGGNDFCSIIRQPHRYFSPYTTDIDLQISEGLADTEKEFLEVANRRPFPGYYRIT